MNYITIDAINDIGTFYGNTARAYPNTWDYNMVVRYITDVIEAMERTAVSKIRGERQPLLTGLNNGGRAELYIYRKKKRIWYFTAEPINDTIDNITIESDILIDNAIYYANESNRAYRRGVSTPTAPLANDDRTHQGMLENINNTIAESILRDIVNKTIKQVLKEMHNLYKRRKVLY